jgi:hypothetical protein
MRNLITLCLAVLTVVLLFIDPASAGFTALGTVAFGFTDGNLTRTRALPSGASAVTTDSIDLGEGPSGTFVTPCELNISAPAVTTAMLANAATIIYDIVTSANADLSSPTVVAKEVLVQTGAGGAGAAAATKRFRFTTDVQRYVGVRATKSATGDASTVSMTISLVF